MASLARHGPWDLVTLQNALTPPPFPPSLGSNDTQSVSYPFDKITIGPKRTSDFIKRGSPTIWRALPHPLAGMAPKGVVLPPAVAGGPTLGLL